MLALCSREPRFPRITEEVPPVPCHYNQSQKEREMQAAYKFVRYNGLGDLWLRKIRVLKQWKMGEVGLKLNQQ